MIEVTCFESVHSWPNILILGSIHGDEKCGSVAIDEAIQNFQSGKWALKKWKITFIPRANRAAYDRDVRQVEYNLNRIFDSHQNISKEHQIAKLLEKHIENADYVIDLHSVYFWGYAFCFSWFWWWSYEKFVRVVFVAIYHDGLEWNLWMKPGKRHYFFCYFSWKRWDDYRVRKS